MQKFVCEKQIKSFKIITERKFFLISALLSFWGWAEERKIKPDKLLVRYYELCRRRMSAGALFRINYFAVSFFRLCEKFNRRLAVGYYVIEVGNMCDPVNSRF